MKTIQVKLLNDDLKSSPLFFSRFD